jgi:hypothetical protein
MLFFLYFPFPFVPLQRRRCLVAPLFLWIVLVPCAGDQPSDRGGEWRGEYDRVSNRDRLKLTPDFTTRWATGNDNFVYSSLWDFRSCFTCRKILRHGDLPALLPIREEGVLRIFIVLRNPSPWPGFEPVTFGSSGKHTNHYTTNATHIFIRRYIFWETESVVKCSINKRINSLEPRMAQIFA